jgi:hypothetical protein
MSRVEITASLEQIFAGGGAKKAVTSSGHDRETSEFPHS